MANDIKIALEGVDGVFIESGTVSQIYLNEVPLLGEDIVRVTIIDAFTDEAGEMIFLQFSGEIDSELTYLLGLTFKLDGENFTFSSKEVNQVDRTIVNITMNGQIYDINTITATLPEGDTQVEPFTDYAVTNNSTVTDPVPEELPPIYDMQQPLIVWGGFSWIDSVVPNNTTYNAKCLQSDGLTAWTPGSDYVPSEARIDFGTNIADTEYIMKPNQEKSFTFVYDLDYGTSYKMVTLNPKGDGATADVLYDGVLAIEDTGLNYTPPLDSIKLKDNMQFTDVPAIPTCVITMSQYTFEVGDTATVTLTFNVEINHLGLSPIVSAENGSLSPFIETPDKPWEYTATFTPDEGVSDDTNVITFVGNTGGVWDNWNNSSNADFQSANYTVNTDVVTGYDVYINYTNQTPDIQDSAGNYLNTVITDTDSGVPASFVDSDNTIVSGFDFTVTSIGSQVWYAGNTSHTNCMEIEQIEMCIFCNTTNSYICDYVIPSGTWDITVLCSRDTGVNGSTEISFGGSSVIVQANNSNSGTHCGTISGVVSDGATPIEMIMVGSTGANNAYLNAIKLTKVS